MFVKLHPARPWYFLVYFYSKRRTPAVDWLWFECPMTRLIPLEFCTVWRDVCSPQRVLIFRLIFHCPLSATSDSARLVEVVNTGTFDVTQRVYRQWQLKTSIGSFSVVFSICDKPAVHLKHSLQVSPKHKRFLTCSLKISDASSRETRASMRSESSDQPPNPRKPDGGRLFSYDTPYGGREVLHLFSEGSHLVSFTPLPTTDVGGK